MLRNGGRGPGIGDSLSSKLAASIVEGFVTNRETKARRGQSTSLNCEFTGCLSKGVLHIIASPCPPPRLLEQGRVIRGFVLPLGAPRKGTGGVPRSETLQTSAALEKNILNCFEAKR